MNYKISLFFTSGTLVHVYCQELFSLLRRRRSGLWISGKYCGILGYSDDNVLCAPSKSGLQDMLNTCQEYAQSHNLQFSTHENPRKCKTKCLAFLIKQRPLSPMKLCGNNLPWVTEGKHLGSIIENKINGMAKDIKVKRAQYIQKNCEILQEFHFAHPRTKFKIHQIYNSSYYGSPLFNIFGRECVMLQNSYNVGIRKFFGLPDATHRFYIEKLTGTCHMQSVLIKRFLKFVDKVKICDKTSFMFKLIKNDGRSVTGHNLRSIRDLVGKNTIDELCPCDADTIVYCETPPEQLWKVNLLHELINVKNEECFLDNFKLREINAMIINICLS